MSWCAQRIHTDLHPQHSENADTSSQGVANSANSAQQDPVSKSADVRSLLHGIGADLREGIGFLWHRHALRVMAISSLFLQSGVSAMIYASQYTMINQGLTAFQISLLDTAFAAAALIGSLIASRAVAHAPTGLLLIVGSLTTVLITLLAVIWHSYTLLMVWMALFGFTLPIFGAVGAGYLFSLTPSGLQGRVNSVMGFVQIAFSSFMPLITGALVAALLVNQAFLIATILTAIAALLICSTPSLRKLGTPDTWQH